MQPALSMRIVSLLTLHIGSFATCVCGRPVTTAGEAAAQWTLVDQQVRLEWSRIISQPRETGARLLEHINQGFLPFENVNSNSALLIQEESRPQDDSIDEDDHFEYTTTDVPVEDVGLNPHFSWLLPLQQLQRIVSQKHGLPAVATLQQLAIAFHAHLLRYRALASVHLLCPEEYVQRFQLFVHNWLRVREHQLRFLQRRVSYSVRLNRFADWSHTEFLQRMAFHSPPATPIVTTWVTSAHQWVLHWRDHLARGLRRRSIADDKEEVDWRKEKVLSPAQDQGECGAVRKELTVSYKCV